MTFSERVADKRFQLMRYIIRKFAFTSDKAEDIVQDTIARALANERKFKGGDNEGKLVNWMKRIAYRIALRRIMRARRSVADDGLSRVPDPAATPSKRARDEERRAEIRSAVLSLPPRQRDLITWSYFLNWPIREIARKIRRSDGSVYRLQSKAIKTLSQRLKRESFDSMLD